MLYFDDENGYGEINGQHANPGQQGQDNSLLLTTLTGDTIFPSTWPHGWPRRASRWDGMRPKEIPFLFDDRSIPRHDRFPLHPYGPVVPDREHVNPETGRIDMDRVYDMMEDRFAINGGDLSVLDKYRYQGRAGGFDADPDPDAGVISAQMRPGGITPTNPNHPGGADGGPAATQPGHFGGSTGEISTPTPGQVPGDRESQCRRQWQAEMDHKIRQYDTCRQRPNWICQDPRQDPDMDYENYRRSRCGL